DELPAADELRRIPTQNPESLVTTTPELETTDEEDQMTLDQVKGEDKKEEASEEPTAGEPETAPEEPAPAEEADPA
ncbi:hypothetical protein N9B94_01495, partial [Verrucomicrobia bacterium]|nr:hypothetical protein [Verrucomicrobiota bacterium]